MQSKILVVADDPAQAVAYSRALEPADYKVLKASNAEEAVSVTGLEQPDLILLDIRRGHASNIEICKQIKSEPELARVLVINISEDQPTVDEAADWVEAGADGYLTGPFSPSMLIAQVRAFLRIKGAEAALVDQQEKELVSLGDFSSPLQTSVSKQLFGAAPLREAAPQVFVELVERYGVLLDLALEERAYKVEHNVSEGFHVLVQHMGFLKAGPRDVVDIHSAAIKKKTSGLNPLKARAYVEEGRLAVLELMGHMVTYYRNHSMAGRRSVASKRAKETRPTKESNV